MISISCFIFFLAFSKVFSKGHSGILTHIFPELGHNREIFTIFAYFVNVIYYFNDKDGFWQR